VTFVWIVISIAVLIIWGISVYDIFRRHLGPGRTAAWLLIVIILPFIGSLVYWAMRPASPDELEAYAGADRELRDQARHSGGGAGV
jgi:Phospholipase_D-nuclease N-terminal